ncbi:MAG: histone deacetylase [bacterium]
MNTLGFFYHPDFLKHETGEGHPERAQRVEAVFQHLLQTPLWSKMQHYQPLPAQMAWLEHVHPSTYIRWVEQQCTSGIHILDDGDTHVCRESFEVARLAVGAVTQAIDEVLNNHIHTAFCAVRPPGHHAGSSSAMGFCLFNNVAIGARYAQEKYGVIRIAIVDWDVHHGNGTQEIFYDDDSVLYISLHQLPLWPGTGTAVERGIDKGEGFTVNCPMHPGSTEKEYLDAFKETILPALKKFKPELLMISAGFDAHRDDPLASINLTEQSYAKFTTLLTDTAAKSANKRIISVLEGGYNPHALATSVEHHLKALID